MAATTSNVYINVIDDVINKIRDDFINSGSGETVLNELQSIWEMKMMQAGAIIGPIERNGGGGRQEGGVHDLNVPYEGNEEYETPTAEMLFPPTPAQTPMPTPLPGSVQTPLPGNVQTPLPGSVDGSSTYNIPTGSSSDYPTPTSDAGGSTEAKPGRPSPYMQPPSWPTQNQRTSNLDVNVAYMEGRDEVDRGTSHQAPGQDLFMGSSAKRKRNDFATRFSNGGSIPQQDGAAGDPTSLVLEVSKKNDSPGYGILSAPKSSVKIPQVDGPIADPYDDELSTPNIYGYQGVVNEDYNIASTPAPNDFQASTPATGLLNDALEDDDDDDEEPLNEDDDDDEDDLDDVDEGEEINTQNLVLAQFDKVTRTKSRWKCLLKNGIIHINNRDILFNKATGEFDF